MANVDTVTSSWLLLRVDYIRQGVMARGYVCIRYGSEFSNLGSFNIVGGMDEQHMLEIIRNNKDQVFLAYMPEWRPFHAQVVAKYTLFADEMQALYDAILHELNQHNKPFNDDENSNNQPPARADIGLFCKIAKRMSQDWSNMMCNMRFGHHTSFREYVVLLDQKSRLGFRATFRKYLELKGMES